MKFSEIPGLEETKKTLINSVKNKHVAHAQLFFGPGGSGNLALALAYATYINCENKQENDSCGICASCSKYNKLIHPDLHFVYPVTTTKQVTKDPLSHLFIKDWRNFVLQNPFGNLNDWSNFIGAENKQLSISVEEGRNIIKTLVLKSFEAEFKVLILWLPENMNVSAANAILKILEEPPEKTIFLLVTNNQDKIITTILSRTQKVKIRGFRDEEILKTLVGVHKVEEKRAQQLAWLAEGDYNEAMRLMDEVEEDNNQLFKDWMRLCYRKNNIKELVEWSEVFQKLGREAQKSLLQYGLTIIRECLVFRHASDLLKLKEDDFKFVEGFSKVLSEDKIEDITSNLNEAFYHIERNANGKIIFLDTSFNLSAIFKRA